MVVDFARTGSAAASSEQVFHGGWGTVASAGLPQSGYLDAHARGGRLPLAHGRRPGHRLRPGGVLLSAGQRTFMHLVADLLDLTPESAAVFDDAVRTGRYVNERYADLLEAIGSRPRPGLTDHDVGDALLAGSRRWRRPPHPS